MCVKKKFTQRCLKNVSGNQIKLSSIIKYIRAHIFMKYYEAIKQSKICTDRKRHGDGDRDGVRDTDREIKIETVICNTQKSSKQVLFCTRTKLF